MDFITIGAIAIVTIYVISIFSGKDTKATKKALSATVSASALKMQLSIEKSGVSENLEWADDLLEEFGYDPKEAIKHSKDIQSLLIEPITATKASRAIK